MSRTKGSITNSAIMTDAQVRKLLEDFASGAYDWNELLSEAGKEIEDIGRMLRGKRRLKPRVWSIQELLVLRQALLNHRKVIKYYIEHLQEEAKNAV